MRYKSEFFSFSLMVAVAAMSVFSSTEAVAAEGITFENVQGRWCGDTSDYNFTRAQLTVTFHSGADKRILVVEKINTSQEWIEFVWKAGGNTVFADFSTNRRSMVQQANVGGDKGPQRIFKRC
jgi:hypothetical protein